MPTYVYYCRDCEDKFEVKASLSEKEKGFKARCTVCGGNNTVQIPANFFSSSRNKNQNFGGGCGPNPSSGCCG